MVLALDSDIFSPLFSDDKVAKLFEDDMFLQTMLEVEGALVHDSISDFVTADTCFRGAKHVVEAFPRPREPSPAARPDLRPHAIQQHLAQSPHQRLVQIRHLPQQFRRSPRGPANPQPVPTTPTPSRSSRASTPFANGQGCTSVGPVRAV